MMKQFKALTQSVLRIEQYIGNWSVRLHTCPQCSRSGPQAEAQPEALPDPEQLLDAGEVMDYLRISRRTFFRLKKEGLLPYRRISGRDYFPRQELAAALTISILKGRL